MSKDQILTFVMVFLFVGLPLLSIVFPIVDVFKFFRGRREEQRTVENPVARGEATIVSARETGTRVNEQPELELQLRVRVEGTAEFSATALQVISLLHAPRLQPGSVVPVAIGEGTPPRVVLLIDK